MATIQSILEFQDKMSSTIVKISQTLENATANMTVAKTSLEMLENEQNQWKQTLDAATSSANKNAEEIENIQKKYDEATKAVDKTKSEIEKYEKIIQQSQQQVDKIDKSQQSFNNTLNDTSNKANNAQMKIITLASAFQLFNQIKGFIQGVNAKINEFVSYAETQARVENQLAIITKQRMSLTDNEVRSLYNLASAQQKIGVIGDEVAIAGMAGLAAFTKQKSSIEALTPAMNNLAVKMYGYNATAESMDMISKSLGKAMLGDVGALSRMGIKIDDNQKKWLMTLNEQQRAIELSKMITAVTGNMNEEMAKTPFGQMTQANNRLSDSYERLGAILLPLQAKFIEIWSNIVSFIVDKIDTMLPLITVALGTVGFAFAALRIQAFLLSKEMQIAALSSIKAWLSAAAPFLIIIGVIGAVSIALNKMGISFKQQAENILISINWIITAVKNLIAHIENIGIALHNAFSKNKWEYKKIEANDFYTNQEKAQKQMDRLSGIASQNRNLLGKTGYSSAIDNSLITSTSGGKALKTQNQGEIEINGEDLQLLHDMATRDYMVKYSQQNLTPQVTFPNVVIHETADVDSVVESFVSAVTDIAQSKLVVA